LITEEKLRYGILKYYKLSNEITKRQKESNNPYIRNLTAEAFTDNIDLNSLIEGFMFKEKWQAELSPLDLSFFSKDVNNAEVQSFSNRISMIKALVKSNHGRNKTLLYNAEKLKEHIINELKARNVEIRNTVPIKILDAIKKGDTKTLHKTLDKATLNDCFYMDFESGNYLVHCITYKSLPALKFFVEQGANLENVCEKKTPLMYAVKYGQLEMVKYLVEQGADLNAKNHGKTPLTYSKSYEHPEIEKYLLEQLKN